MLRAACKLSIALYRRVLPNFGTFTTPLLTLHCKFPKGERHAFHVWDAVLAQTLNQGFMLFSLDTCFTHSTHASAHIQVTVTEFIRYLHLCFKYTDRCARIRKHAYRFTHGSLFSGDPRRDPHFLTPCTYQPQSAGLREKKQSNFFL